MFQVFSSGVSRAAVTLTVTLIVRVLSIYPKGPDKVYESLRIFGHHIMVFVDFTHQLGLRGLQFCLVTSFRAVKF